MVKVRLGEKLAIDLEKVIGWTYIAGQTDQQDLTISLQLLGFPVPTLKVEERIVLYTSGETLVIAKAAVGSEPFTAFHNCLLSLFDDFGAAKSSG